MPNKLKVSLKRKCPNCGDEILYSTKYVKIRAEKNNAKCGTCASWNKGKIDVYSEETLKKNSESHKGKTPWNKGKVGVFSKETLKKMRLTKIGTTRPQRVKDKIRKTLTGHKRYRGKQKERWIKKISLSKIGHEVTQEVRDKIGKTVREYRFNEIKEKFGIKFPNYNKIGCDIIRWFNMYYDFNFRHAENGGEVCIGGYWPDGLDEKRKTIIEIDEKHHFDANGKLKQKDIQRQRYLEGLGYKVIRIKV